MTLAASRPTIRHNLPPRDAQGAVVRSREGGVDAVRFLAFAAVVLIHLPSYHVPADMHITPGAVLDQVCRFAVPFYFVASGYFLGARDLSASTSILRFVSRLLPVFAVWAAVYLAVSGTTLADLQEPLLWRSVMLRGGPGYHLWYLPSLGVCVSLAILLRRSPVALALWIGLSSFAIGLAFGPYRDWLGLPSIGDTRTGPWFGLVFVVAGMIIRSLDPARRPAWGLGLVALGILSQIGEAATLAGSGHGRFAPNDFLLGTLPLGVGVFLLARSLPESPAVDRVAMLGRLSLGMYCVHLLFVWLLVGAAQVQIGPWRQWGLTFAVVAFSGLTAMALARIPVLAWLVR